MWGNICRQLIETCGIHVYNNWFSKLIPIIDKDAKIIELKAPNSFVQEEVIQRYENTIKKVANDLGMKFKQISKRERYNQFFYYN